MKECESHKLGEIKSFAAVARPMGLSSEFWPGLLPWGSSGFMMVREGFYDPPWYVLDGRERGGRVLGLSV